jgi:hypothetical protein
MEGVPTISSFSFILIPGAGGRAWYWHLVAPKLREHGHEAVAVELPAADDQARLPEYADSVVHAIGDRDPFQGVADRANPGSRGT